LNLQLTVYALMAFCAGALFPVQAAVNAMLGRGIGGPIVASLVSFVAGATALLIFNTVLFRQWPRWSEVAAQPLTLWWVGGMLGALFLSANVVVAPRLGSAATLGFVMAGQLLSALVIDRFGLFGFALRDLSLGRVGGVALVAIGALMVRLT
jgi:transporter family-2 protein